MPAKAADPVLLGFDEMYGPASVLGITFSDKLKSLNGKLTSVRGFMAPPLKADAKFLVLTRSPVNLVLSATATKTGPTQSSWSTLKTPETSFRPIKPLK